MTKTKNQKDSNKKSKTSRPYFEKAYEIRFKNDLKASAMIDNNNLLNSMKNMTSKQLNHNLTQENRSLIAITTFGIIWRRDLETGKLISRINCINDDIKIVRSKNSLAVDIEDFIKMINSSETISDSIITDFTLSKDGSMFVIIVDGNKLATFNTTTGKQISRFFTFEEIVTSLVESEDIRKSLLGRNIGKSLKDPCFTNDGNYIVTYLYGEVAVLIDLKKQIPAYIFNEENIGLVSSLDRDVCRILGSLSDSCTNLKKQNEAINKMDFNYRYINFLTEDHKHLVIGSYFYDKKTRMLPKKWETVWFEDDEKPVHPEEKTNRKRLTHFHSIIKWDIENSKTERGILNIPSYVGCLNVSQDNKYLVAGFVNGVLKIYDFKTLKTIQTLNLDYSLFSGKIRILNDMEYITTQRFDYLTVWKNKNA